MKIPGKFVQVTLASNVPAWASYRALGDGTHGRLRVVWDGGAAWNDNAALADFTALPAVIPLATFQAAPWTLHTRPPPQ